MIVSLFYVLLNLLGLSFLEKGGKALLLGSFFSGEVPNQKQRLRCSSLTGKESCHLVASNV